MCQLYAVVRTVKYQWLWWTEHVDMLGEVRNAYRILIMKYSLGRLRKRVKNNSKFAQYCVLCWALQSVGLTFWMPWFARYCIIEFPPPRINLTCLTELKLVFYCLFTASHKKHSAGCAIKTWRATVYVAQLVWWAVWRCNESDWQDAICWLSGPIRRWVSASYLWVESWNVQLINTTNWESVVWKRIM
jgi:hypothetical protein